MRRSLPQRRKWRKHEPAWLPSARLGWAQAVNGRAKSSEQARRAARLAAALRENLRRRKAQAKGRAAAAEAAAAPHDSAGIAADKPKPERRR
jgi:hypothetical protein